MSGICLCGCGGETKPATMTNKKYGWVKGQPNKYIRGHNRPWLGKKRPALSVDVKQKMRIGHLGKKYNVSDSGRAAIIAATRKALTGKKLTPEHIRNSMRRRPITSLELAFMKIIDENGLPYKFVGNGSFIIDGLNPDFINIDGKKIAIEVYARMYKNIDGRSVEKYKTDRIKRLSPFGWKLYFFDETQVNNKFVLETLGGDSNRCGNV